MHVCIPAFHCNRRKFTNSSLHLVVVVVVVVVNGSFMIVVSSGERCMGAGIIGLRENNRSGSGTGTSLSRK